jgi:rhodanese-related sulfurtransferase
MEDLRQAMADYSDFLRLVEAARPGVEEIAPSELRARVAAGAVLIDVREEVELRRNPPLARAVHLPRGEIEYSLGDAVADKDTPIVLYCAYGMRSVLAAATLKTMGYAHVAVLHKGLHALRREAGQNWNADHSRMGNDDNEDKTDQDTR